MADTSRHTGDELGREPSEVDKEWEALAEADISEISTVSESESASDDVLEPDPADFESAAEFPVHSLEELSEQLDDDTSWAQELVGAVFGGRYRLDEELARGGMGVVFRGTQINLKRPVVVKVISRMLVEGPEDIARFELEAMGLSQLQHPNIVTIHDFGSERGLSYIAMEYVDGETLKDRLDRHPTIAPEDFVRIAPQILRAIGEAHDMGIIHRDIKPSNVVLTERNQQPDFVKVVDFGLVKLVDANDEITGKGLVGTFGYVSPEQILGEEFDARSDVYALGVLFYRMLAGRKPFEDPDGMAVLYKHVNDEPPPLESLLPDADEVPSQLVSIIHQCLAKDPARRPRDANDLLAILIRKGVLPDDEASGPRALANHRRTWIGPSASAVIEARPPERRRLALWLALLAVTVLAFFSSRDFARDESVDAEASSDSSAVAAGPARASVEAVLDDAERLLEEGEFSKSRKTLGHVESAVVAYPDLLQRSVDLESRVDVGELMQEARDFERRDDLEHAADRYRDVLEIDPTNEVAFQALAALDLAEDGELSEAESLDLAAAAEDAEDSQDSEDDIDAASDGKGATARAASPEGGERDAAPAKELARKKAAGDQPKEQRPEPGANGASAVTIASPRLPNAVRLQDRQMLERLLRRIEGEVVDRNAFTPLQVQNVTHRLYRALAADLRESKQPKLNPRAIYYQISNSLKAGSSRDAVARALEREYRAGGLQ